MINFVTETIKELNSSGKNFGSVFVERRMEFIYRFGFGFINSTYHGADFFQNVLDYHNCPDKWKECEGESVYQENFKKMLKANRS